jgi:hypothetical protein
MAVTLDVKFEKGGDVSSPSPFSFVSNAGTVAGTVSVGATHLFAVAQFDTAISSVGTVSVTWDQGGTNQAMTQITSSNDSGTNLSVFLFGLANPTSGAKTIQMTWTGSAESKYLGAVSVFGSSSWSDATTNTGNGTTTTITVPNVGANDMAINGRGDLNSSGPTWTVTTGTIDWEDHHFNTNSGQAHNSGSGTVAWNIGGSGVNWIMVGVRAVASAADSAHLLGCTGAGA